MNGSRILKHVCALIRLNMVIQNLEAVLRRNIYGPVHEILVLITYAQKSPLNAHADVYSRA